ncbi:MAG: hypothetical protein LBH67_02745, partial [Rickettsia sp.]|nr:hypothetical protein [Rickettsia sp.]
LQSFKNIRVDDFFCNFLDKRFCFFFLKLEQIFIFQRSHIIFFTIFKHRYSIRVIYPELLYLCLTKKFITK